MTGIMAKKGGKAVNKVVAKLVTENRVPCAFCHRDVDAEITYGKLYSIGDIQCHYFCVLLSCCLIQKGKDDKGLFGFLYPDILAELERSKKHRCSYCNKEGATLGCSITQCRKQFHLPCGRERNAVSLFYGNYKSFCQAHAPKQKIPEVIMSKARVRMKEKNKAIKLAKSMGLSVATVQTNYDVNDSLKAECVCVICYEEVDAFPSTQTFWAPCCASDAWFHRSCLERMALSAGMHYLKCPLCNDKENFYQAVIQQGYYVPDRDAAWELEQNAFAEIYERPLSCSVSDCKCPLGPNHDAEIGIWDVKLCLLCGSVGIHAQCLVNSGVEGPRFICSICQPAAPQDMDKLAAAIDSIIVAEQSRGSSTANRPMMTSRMSLRRTKQRMAYMALGSSDESSSSTCIKTEVPDEDTSNTAVSRLELNIRPPLRKVKQENNVAIQRDADMLMSPVKLLQLRLLEKKRRLNKTETESIVLDERLVERLRQKMRRPKPLCVKKRIVDRMLEEYINNLAKEKGKKKTPIKEWNSPKKESDTSESIAKENQIQCLSPEQVKSECNVTDNIDNSTVTEVLSRITRRSTRQSMGTPGPSGDGKSSAVETEFQSTSNISLVQRQLKPSPHKSQDNLEHIDLKDVINKPTSPKSILEMLLTQKRRLGRSETDSILSDSGLWERLRLKMSYPQPLSKKMNIIDCMLDEFLGDAAKEIANNTKAADECKSPRKKVMNENNGGESQNLVSPGKDSATPLDDTVTTDNTLNIDNPLAIDEESSNSTFVLPSEFIADKDSDDSLPIFDTPKTVNIQTDSSVEISENNDVVTIDLVKIESKSDCDINIPALPEKCALKFNPADKEALKNTDEGIDIECFKNQYLNEVERRFKCQFNHKHDSQRLSPKHKTPIDFAMEAEARLGRKRKPKRMKSNGKRRKTDDVVLRFENSTDTGRSKKKKKKEKLATSLSITNDDMQVKISLKKKKFRLRIMKTRKKSPPRNLKQYVLKYSDSSPLIEKPEQEVTPMKRKYVKQGKSPDNMKQTSLHSFFKTKSQME